MSFAVKEGALWRELVPGEQVVIEDVASSWDTVLAWSSQYRTGQGVRVIEETPIPAGKISTGSRIEDQDGKPVRVHDLADAPPLEPAVIVVNAGDLWRRATDAEAEAIEGAMAAQSAKLRNLFRTVATFQSDDPLWPVLTGAATQLFGADRATELLAPSA